MYKKLRVWAKHRHRNKTTKWIANKYWQSIGGDNWVFATSQEGKNLKPNFSVNQVLERFR